MKEKAQKIETKNSGADFGGRVSEFADDCAKVGVERQDGEPGTEGEPFLEAIS